MVSNVVVALQCSKMRSWCTRGHLSWWPPASSVWWLRSPTTGTKDGLKCRRCFVAGCQLVHTGTALMVASSLVCVAAAVTNDRY
jgi:hypothetical protein